MVWKFNSFILHKILFWIIFFGWLGRASWGERTGRATARNSYWRGNPKDILWPWKGNSFCKNAQLFISWDKAFWTRNLWRWSWWGGDSGWRRKSKVRMFCYSYLLVEYSILLFNLLLLYLEGLWLKIWRRGGD